MVAREAGLLRGAGDVAIVALEQRSQILQLEGVDDPLLGLLEVEAGGNVGETARGVAAR